MDDKKYIESLSNFASALDQLVDEMKNQSKAKQKGVDKPSGKPSGKPIEDGGTLISIQKGIDEIKSDTKKILDNQETILKMNKDSKKSGGLMSGVTDKKKKKKVKDGVSTIILMAGAVLAIGLAFKVIGGVDFMSVIALSFALPLIAFAFVQVATAISEKDLGMDDLLFTAFALVLMAGALTISSWIMGAIVPIGIFQFITAIGISITLAIVAIGASFMLDNLKDVGMDDILKLPLILITLAGAIAVSSGILGMTSMIDPSLLLNIVLQGIAMGIISVILSIPMIIFAKLGLKTTDVFQGAINIVLIAGAIAVSSQLLSMGDYSVIPSIEWAFGASVSVLLFSIPVVALGLLSMTGVGLVAIALGSVMTLMVAGTLMLTSHILSAGKYETYPDLEWVTSISLSLGVFSALLIGLGAVALSGIGFLAVLAGAGMSLIIAETIVSVSKTLGNGDYSYSSNLGEWAKATSSLYTTFTPIMVALGAMGLVSAVIGMFGGPDPFEIAKRMMIQIAETIVSVSDVLSGGTWSGGPDEEWATGVGLAIGAFAPVYSYLQKSKVMSAFFGGEAMKPEEYTETMENIGRSINAVGEVFAEGKVDKWEGGPDEEWATGVGLAIGAFAPVFGILNTGGIMSAILGGPSVEDMMIAIIGISTAIKIAGGIFTKDGTVYEGGPKKEWSEGVGGAIKVFTELYSWTSGVFSDWDEDNIKKANKVIFTIAGSILDMSKVFQGYYVNKDGQLAKGPTPIWTAYPDSKWTKGVGGALQGFADIYQWADDDNWSMDYMNLYKPVIEELANSILDTSNKLSGMNLSEDPSKHVKGLAKSLDSWTKVFDKVENLNTDEFWEAANSLRSLSDGFNQLAESLTNVGSSIEGFNPDFIKVMADVSGVEIEMKNKEDKENKEEEEASWWSKLLGLSPQKEEESTPTVKPKATTKEEGMKLEDIHSKLEELNTKLQMIAQNSNNMSEYVDELRSGSNQGIEIDM